MKTILPVQVLVVTPCHGMIGMASARNLKHREVADLLRYFMVASFYFQHIPTVHQVFPAAILASNSSRERVELVVVP